ncbi:MAG: 23S rRNA (pseudouridine(1915)-N(3))-methyltransferase RlmH [Desulfitobacteriaceae bacterium]
MLQIKVVAVGKVREKFLQDGIKEYQKRLGPLARLEIVEVADEPCPERLSAGEEEKLKTQEGERILRAISPQDYVILLDIEGKQLASPGVARLLEDLAMDGRSALAFVIGGSLGVSAAVKERSDIRWSFSKLTFPHQLMRLVLLEQVYRAFKISRGEPYHTIL